MKKFLIVAVIIGLLTAPSAEAWGPRAQVSVVNTAAQLLAKDGNAPLRRYGSEIREGASASREVLSRLMPEADSNPARAIETEMALLQALQEEHITAYMAYRLGVLGKVVAGVTAPMHEAPRRFSELYYADVDQNIGRSELKAAERRTVDPNTYIPQRMMEARINDEMILREYQGGQGFEGVAQSTLPEAASRSVNSVADVWHTILTSTSVAGGVSEAQRQSYVADAMRFYVARGNRGEMEKARERLAKVAEESADLVEKIGDAYYDGGVYDKAIKEYEQVLELDSSRRSVVTKIADYYVERGEEAMAEQRLEDAQAAFESASRANALDPRAEGLRLEAQRQLTAREARHNESRTALDRAGEFMSMADQEALDNRFAEALALYRQAELSYQEVSEEFPVEYQRSLQGLKNVAFQVDEMKQELIANAQTFSGRGYGDETRKLAQERLPSLSETTLKGLVRMEYEAQMQALQGRLDSEVNNL